MDKVEFITKLEAVKDRLPVGVVPLYMKAYPEASLSRVKNTMSGKIQDQKILKNLEEIANTIEKL